MFDQLTPSYNEDNFWENVLDEFGRIRNVKVTPEILLEASDSFVEFGMDYNNQTYDISLEVNSHTTHGNPWHARIVSYPDANIEIEIDTVQMINNPKVMAAFLAVVMP